MVDGAALEKRSPRKRSVGSNPTLSAINEAMDEVKHKGFIDRQNPPTDKDILTAIDSPLNRLYKKMRTFLASNYDFYPELTFGGKKYGWGYKYRRKGKTLCVLFPEEGAFTVLVVLGGKGASEFAEDRLKYNDKTQELFDTTCKYHDGMWLFKRVLCKEDLDDAVSLIGLKKKPKSLS